MFNISDLSMASQPTEKSYTFPFKDTFSASMWSSFLDMFPRQN